jgi:hypothetical protein
VVRKTSETWRLPRRMVVLVAGLAALLTAVLLAIATLASRTEPGSEVGMVLRFPAEALVPVGPVHSVASPGPTAPGPTAPGPTGAA